MGRKFCSNTYLIGDIFPVVDMRPYLKLVLPRRCHFVTTGFFRPIQSGLYLLVVLFGDVLQVSSKPSPANPSRSCVVMCHAVLDTQSWLVGR